MCSLQAYATWEQTFWEHGILSYEFLCTLFSPMWTQTLRVHDVLQKSYSNWSILWNWGTISRGNVCAVLFHRPEQGVVWAGRVHTGDLLNSTPDSMALWPLVEDNFVFVSSRIGVRRTMCLAHYPPRFLFPLPFLPNVFQQHTGSHLQCKAIWPQ